MRNPNILGSCGISRTSPPCILRLLSRREVQAFSTMRRLWMTKWVGSGPPSYEEHQLKANTAVAESTTITKTQAKKNILSLTTF